MSEERLPPSEKELLRWAMENSTDASEVRKDKLMSHEEFKEMWEELCPDVIKALKENIAIIKEPKDDEQLYLALDKVLFYVEDIDAADWFVDLEGYKLVVPLLTVENVELRRAAAWIIGNTLQNNPKDQDKFLKQVGMTPVVESFVSEEVEEPLKKKFTLLTNAVRGSKALRKQFYEIGGLQKLKVKCEQFPMLFFRLCWLVGAILDEEDEEDLKVFAEDGMKEYLSSHRADINDDDVLDSVLIRLK